MALQLNGSSQYARRAYSRANSLAVTISCRFRTPTTLASSEDAVFGLIDTGTGNNYIRIGLNSTNELRAVIKGPTTSVAAVSASALTADTWYTCTVTYDGTSLIEMWLNSDAKVTNTGTPGAATYTDVAVGHATSNGSPGGHWPGKVAYCGVWDVVLSDATIALIAGGDKPTGHVTNLVDAWDLVSDNLSDNAGTSMTLTGSPTFDSDNPLSSNTFSGTTDTASVTGLDWVLRATWDATGVTDSGTGLSTDVNGDFSGVTTVADAGSYYLQLRKSDGSLYGIKESVTVV